MEQKYAVLGIHENVARIRIFTKSGDYDFDLSLPEVKTQEQLIKEAVEVELEKLNKDQDNEIIIDTKDEVVHSLNLEKVEREEKPTAEDKISALEEKIAAIERKINV